MKMKNKKAFCAVVKTVIIGLLSLAFLLPLVWMVTSSVKNTNEVFSANWRWLPADAPFEQKRRPREQAARQANLPLPPFLPIAR